MDTKEKKYKCTCGFSANTVMELIKHVSVEHKEIIVDKCIWKSVYSDEKVCSISYYKSGCGYHKGAKDGRFYDGGICPYCGKEIKFIIEDLPNTKIGMDKNDINYMNNMAESINNFSPIFKDKKVKVITICGSTRFTKEMLIKQWELTKQGHVVMSWCALPDDYYKDKDKTHIGDQEGVKEIVDEGHKRKIDLSDEIFVLNIGGYIGESTRSEIDYAKKKGKIIKYLEPVGKGFDVKIEEENSKYIMDVLPLKSELGRPLLFEKDNNRIPKSHYNKKDTEIVLTMARQELNRLKGTEEWQSIGNIIQVMKQCIESLIDDLNSINTEMQDNRFVIVDSFAFRSMVIDAIPCGLECAEEILEWFLKSIVSLEENKEDRECKYKRDFGTHIYCRHPKYASTTPMRECNKVKEAGLCPAKPKKKNKE